jgi:hypothetical protein
MLPRALRSQASSLVALAGLVAVSLGGWLLWSGSAPPPHVRPGQLPPDDDLEMMARMIEAGPAPVADLMAATAGALVTARGDDGEVQAWRPRGRVDSRDSGNIGKTGDTGNPADAADAGMLSVVLARVGSPVTGLAVAGGSAWVAAGHGVRRIPLAGGPPSVLTDALDGPLALVADGRTVVVVDVDARTPGLLRASRVVAIDAATGALTVLGRTQGEAAGLALDAGVVYWADRLEGTVLSAPASGGPARVLAQDRGLPELPTIAGGTLAWVERRSSTLVAIPKAGGAPRPLAQDFAGFAHLTADGAAFAWVNEAAVEGRFRVLEVPAEGGETESLTDAVDAIDAIASDGTHLYWMRDDRVARIE